MVRPNYPRPVRTVTRCVEEPAGHHAAARRKGAAPSQESFLVGPLRPLDKYSRANSCLSSRQG